MLIRFHAWSCLEIRMRDEVTIYKIDNSSFEMVEEFRYLGRTITHQNSIQEEIKSRQQLGNAYYHAVHNFLPSSLLSKNLKMRYTEL